MKHGINLLGSICILVFSPVVHAHIAAEHSYGFAAGLLHMLTEPSHVWFWLPFFVLLLLVTKWKKVVLFLNWLFTNRFS